MVGVCELTSFMFRKYLLKNNFWKKKSGTEEWFIQHNPKYGGIYAKLLDRGVEIKYNNQTFVFTNFTELDNFLNKIYTDVESEANEEFNRLLRRNYTSKMLRTELSF